MDGLIAQVATYHGTMFEFTELLRATHSFTNVCRSSLPVAMEVIGTPESKELKVCPNTFGNIVYLSMCLRSSSVSTVYPT
ncbi:unnamed protein product [Staurois parvus]|uniref:Uncharacterized protein n=1 Tax=Staurois parvus TaxID=386267 RepID=A0ABN9DLI9_9NEOB|nr:unnamed protein product [Staurois parvus]